MKFVGDGGAAHDMASLPARGVWVEMKSRQLGGLRLRSLPARGVWVEIWFAKSTAKHSKSLPARGVWVEIA